jgi:hypothetical protein
MRTNDPTDSEPKFRPLGEKVTKPATVPASPSWTQVPGAAKGVGVGSDGKLSTKIPGNLG